MAPNDPTQPAPPEGDVAGGIVQLFEAEAARAETERRAARMMLHALDCVIGEALAALTVVSLHEWREKRRRRQTGQ